MKEKAATRARDALAAERRRLPMVKIDKDYVFEGDHGKARLDMFEGRRQLIMYHVMFGPTRSEGCVGCSMSVDDIGHLSHLHARDTSLVLVSRAPYSKLKAYHQRMGWTVPWFSSFGSDYDFGVTVGEEEKSGVSAFLRDGDSVYCTYFTSGRGDEMLGGFGCLDLTPFGRRETWEDSPAGWPQTPPYDWWRHHDKTGAAMNPLESVVIDCPYCGERIALLIDSSEDYIEDCQVCSQPINVSTRVGMNGAMQVTASRDDD